VFGNMAVLLWDYMLFAMIWVIFSNVLATDRRKRCL